MSYTITDTDELTITITDGYRTVVISKFRLAFEVEEPYLTIYWNLSEQGSGLDRPFITLDYTTVSSPVSTSAADLQTQIQAMQVSAFVPGGGEDLNATLALGDDAGGQEITNLSLIRDDLGRVAVDIFNRTLKDSSGNINLDWETPAMPNLATGGAAKMVTVNATGDLSTATIPAGDVVGPASAVDDRIATFDGTTGKLIQDGGKTINDIVYSSISTKTTDYTLALADVSSFIITDTTTSLKITIPTNASVAFPIGTKITVGTYNTGLSYFEAAVGVTLHSFDELLGIISPHGVVRLTKTDTNTWYLDGDLKLALDSDAEAFINAVGTFSTAEQGYINAFFLALKATGSLYTKTEYCHLYMGGTSSSMKLNIVDPTDADSSFRLTFVGSPTLNANGCTFNGTTQYINTHYVPSTYANQNDKAYAFYFRSVGTNGANFGAINAFFQGDEMLIVNYGATTGWTLGRTDDTFTRGGTYNGFYLLNRTGVSTNELRRNDVQLDTEAGSTIVNAAVDVYIGARNRAGVGAEIFCADNICFDWKGDGLTSAEATALYNACANLQTSLGR